MFKTLSNLISIMTHQIPSNKKAITSKIVILVVINVSFVMPNQIIVYTWIADIM